MKALKHINKYFKKYKYRLILGVFISIASRIFSVAGPKFVGDAVALTEDYLTNNLIDLPNFKKELTLYFFLIVGATLLSGFFMFLMRQTFIVVSRFIEFDLKNEIYEHYQKLSTEFYKANRTGDLMNRISEDVMKVRMYAGPAIMYSVNTITLFVIALSYMSSIAPKLTLYTIAPLPILSFAIYHLSVAINKRTTIVQQYLSKLTSFSQETFSGISVLKAYKIENQKNKEFENLSNESKNKSIQLSAVQALFQPLMILLIGCSNIIVIYIGGNQYLSGEIADFGVLVEFILYVNMLTWPVATVGWVSSMIQQADASQTRINEFLKTTPKIQNISNAIDLEINNHIEFKDIEFTYPDTGITALNKLNFKINHGQTVGVIGNTGSGKSSLLELISRMYDPTSGQILVDGVDLKNINIHNYRAQMGYVPQDSFLFSDTIANNISFGKSNATNKDIIEAAKTAAVHKNIINFKDQYQTILGERGVTLSGGQKQRVSIARALIKEPKLLLLDDCLSAVDTETEEKIIENFNSLSSKKTCFIVSHRISSVKDADVILVLDKGTILQQGKHKDLIKIEGYYKNLYEKQLNKKEF